MIVSVCIVTYNQVEFIANCIESVLNQKTDFDFEIIIGDDNSSDGTKKILKEFKQKHPNQINLILNEQNIGAWENFHSVHKSAIGKYVAHLDGDDYFLPGKLQAQVAYMEKNENCTISWHRMYSLKNNTLKPDKIDPIYFEKVSKEMLLSLITIGANSSKMYRNGSLSFSRPPFPVLDYYANYLQMGNGYASFIGEEIFGVYRLGEGMSTSMNTRKLICKTILHINNENPKYKKYINSAAFFLFIVELKNGRKFALNYLLVFIKSFHLLSLFQFIKNIKYYKYLKY